MPYAKHKVYVHKQQNALKMSITVPLLYKNRVLFMSFINLKKKKKRY